MPKDQQVKIETTLVVGRDMRPHSPALAKALIDGIRSVGMNVIDVGMVDTSFIYFAINHLDVRRRHHDDGVAQSDPIQRLQNQRPQGQADRAAQRVWMTSSASPSTLNSCGHRAAGEI